MAARTRRRSLLWPARQRHPDDRRRRPGRSSRRLARRNARPAGPTLATLRRVSRPVQIHRGADTSQDDDWRGPPPPPTPAPQQQPRSGSTNVWLDGVLGRGDNGRASRAAAVVSLRSRPSRARRRAAGARRAPAPDRCRAASSRPARKAGEWSMCSRCATSCATVELQHERRRQDQPPRIADVARRRSSSPSARADRRSTTRPTVTPARAATARRFRLKLAQRLAPQPAITRLPTPSSGPPTSSRSAVQPYDPRMAVATSRSSTSLATKGDDCRPADDRPGLRQSASCSLDPVAMGLGPFAGDALRSAARQGQPHTAVARIDRQPASGAHRP